MQHNSNQHAHIFAQVPRLSIKDRNESVAREFCKCYQRQYGNPTEFVAAEVNDLDAIIRVSHKPIVLEMVGYRQRDTYLEVERADTEVKKRISRELESSAMPPCQLLIWWRTESRRKRRTGQSAQIARIPSGRALGDFAQEFLALVRHVLRNDALTNKDVLFRCTRRTKHALFADGRYAVLEESVFPALAHHCSFIRIEPWDRDFAPTIGTSHDARQIGLDTRHLTTVVRKKLRKLPTYRRRAGDAPIWLVVHADGFPPSTRVPAPDRPRALETIRQEVSGAGISFDRVWWAEETGYLDATRLFEVS